MAGCGTLEENAWTSGVRPEDAMEISRAVRADKKAHKIYQYLREDDGSILVSTDVGIFKARRINGKWRFTEVVIVT